MSLELPLTGSLEKGHPGAEAQWREVENPGCHLQNCVRGQGLFGLTADCGPESKDEKTDFTASKALTAPASGLR